MGKLKLKNNLTFDIEKNDSESSFKYLANQTSDQNEISELYTHIQNAKYFLALYNAKVCEFVYNGVQDVKVYRFSLVRDSMQIYLMTKYYRISQAQTDRVIEDYRKLVNERYGVGEENPKKKLLVIIGWENFRPSKFNVRLYSIAFICYSFFTGVFMGSPKFSTLEFGIMVFLTAILGFMACAFIYKRNKPIVNEEAN